MNYAWFLFSPFGRIRRRMYWRGLAMTFIVSAAFGHLASRFDHPLVGAGELFVLWPLVCVLGKRLHDLGLSAWWQLIWWGLQTGGLAALLVAMTSGQAPLSVSQETAAITVVMTIATLGFLGWLGIVEGPATPNRFGPWPGDPQSAVDVFS